MIVVSAQIRLYAPFVHSLKEKRMIVKSLNAKIGNRFNVSVGEVAEQDIHQTIVLGVACVVNSVAFGQGMIDRIVAFIESNTEAEITEVLREIR